MGASITRRTPQSRELDTQLRTGKIGLAGFLHKARVPGFHTGICNTTNNGKKDLGMCSFIAPGSKGTASHSGTTGNSTSVDQFRLANQLIKDG
ncbi:hypothetical protein VTN31DRAFT_551 [Thermomyces dupontii]|uniref:uncharacterized protein n=1 Tax=Talaromyces thermophilus TaxID=28565 RepID=UPI00374419E7